MRFETLGAVAAAVVDRSLRRPRATLVVVAVVVLVVSLGILRSEIRTDGRALVPQSDPAVRFDDEVRRHFGLRDPIVVIVASEHPDGLFNLDTLRRVRSISAALQALDGIEPGQVTSLATEIGDRVVPGSTSDFLPLVDEPLETASDVLRVRRDLDGIATLEGTLVSRDRRSTAILVGVPLDPAVDRRALVRQIVETVEPLLGDDHLDVVGAPVAEALLGDHLVRDLIVLLPVVLLVVALVLYLGCRRLWGVALGMAEVGAAQLFTFGFMGWTGTPIYLTTAVLPVILVTLGLADEIHVFWRHQQNLARPDGPRGVDAVRETLDQMVPPLVATTATTGLGFLSFLASPLAAVREFGLFAALGILFCLVFTLTAVPAGLALLGDDKLRRPTRTARSGSSDWTARAVAPVVRHPTAALAALAGLTLALGLGIGRLQVQDGWLDGFAADSPFRRAVERTHERFHGTHLLRLHLQLEPLSGDPPRIVHGPPGPLVLPETLEAIGSLEAFLRDQPGVGGVLGPHAQLVDVAYLRGGRRAAERRVPSDPLEVAELWHWFDQVRGEHRRREWVDDARHRAVITAFLGDANYRDTATLMTAIDRHAGETLAGRGMEIRFAGDVAVSQAMIPAIVRTQVGSLVVALLGALLMVAWLHRSWRVGLRVVAPAAVAVTWIFGAMGWAGIPLGVATSMFCAITLGVGVDHAIHFHHAWARDSVERAGRAVPNAWRSAGPAIFADTAAVALGFGVLAFSAVPANVRLGLLVGAALVASWVLTLVGLGAWLHRYDRHLDSMP